MLYPSFAPRITTYDASGHNLSRWTLQQPKGQGRILTIDPVAKESYGRPPNAMRSVVLHGFRIKFQCEWDYGLSSFKETWSGTAWNASVETPTMMALVDIAQASEIAAVQVEASKGVSSPWWFLGRTYNQVQDVQDQSGILHKNLITIIESETLMPSIPDFGGYYVPGYFATPGGDTYI